MSSKAQVPAQENTSASANSSQTWSQKESRPFGQEISTTQAAASSPMAPPPASPTAPPDIQAKRETMARAGFSLADVPLRPSKPDSSLGSDHLPFKTKTKLAQSTPNEAQELKSTSKSPDYQKADGSKAQEEMQQSDSVQSAQSLHSVRKGGIQAKFEGIQRNVDEANTDPLKTFSVIQTKLAIGQPGDKYEQEADRTAARVMRMPDPQANEDDESTRKTDQPQVQRKGGKDQTEQSYHLENQLARQQGQGNPLPENVRSFMEPRFGHNFSQVRLHTDSSAVQMNKELGARAFAYKNDIYFNAGQYNPSSAGGQELLAHELTHTIQQTGGVQMNKDADQPSIGDVQGEAVQAKSLAAASEPSMSTSTVSQLNQEESEQDPEDTLETEQSASSPPENPAENPPEDPSEQNNVIQRQPLNISSVNPQIQGLFGIGDGIKGEVSRRAEEHLPGYSLLTFIIGKDPITDEPVARNATNFVEAALDLVPNGDKIFNNLKESGALDKVFDWLEDQIKTLNLTWDYIKGLFQRAWDALTGGLVNPFDVFEDIKNIFLPPIARLTNFLVESATKVMEMILEAAIALASGSEAAQQVMEVLRSAGSTFNKILEDPPKFLSNLLDGLGKGLNRFKDNIVQHLQSGLIGWLTGTLGPMGIEMPEDIFSAKGVFSLVMQVLGLTWDYLRRKAVRMFGEEKVGAMEEGVELFQVLREGGVDALWEEIKTQLGDLKQSVMDEIKNMLIVEVIRAGVVWIISLFSPASGLVRAAKMIFDVVMFVIDRASQIMELVQSVTNSISAIANGDTNEMGAAIENSLAAALPVAIGFMASLLGLGNLAKKVTRIIDRIRDRIDEAIEWVLEKVRRLFKGKKKKENDNDRTTEEKKADLEAAEKEIKKVLSSSENTEDAEKYFPEIKNKFKLKKIEWRNLGASSANIFIEINPKAEIDFGKLIWTGNLEFQGEQDPATGKAKESKVDFSGDIVTGKTMEAHMLGPNHPKGSEPQAGVLDGVFGRYNLAAGSTGTKYLRGHLLSDFLGGPGVEENLYPITGHANSQHQQRVESKIKNWVNNLGYWIYYKVEVKPTSPPIPGSGVIDSDMTCEAYKLDINGKKSEKDAIKFTIHSEGSQMRFATKEVAGGSDPTADKPRPDANFAGNEKNVELPERAYLSPTLLRKLEEEFNPLVLEIQNLLDDMYVRETLSGLIEIVTSGSQNSRLKAAILTDPADVFYRDEFRKFGNAFKQENGSFRYFIQELDIFKPRLERCKDGLEQYKSRMEEDDENYWDDPKRETQGDVYEIARQAQNGNRNAGRNVANTQIAFLNKKKKNERRTKRF